MNISRNTMILLALALLFFAPGFLAFYYYQHPMWLRGASTNRGELLSPPIHLDALVGKKWQLLLWVPKECDAACRKLQIRLGKIRLALGRHYYEVDERILTPTELTPVDAFDIQVLRVQKPLGAMRVFIASPRGDLMLAYSRQVSSSDVYHDLKQLLMTQSI